MEYLSVCIIAPEFTCNSFPRLSWIAFPSGSARSCQGRSFCMYLVSPFFSVSFTYLSTDKKSPLSHVFSCGLRPLYAYRSEFTKRCLVLYPEMMDESGARTTSFAISWHQLKINSGQHEQLQHIALFFTSMLNALTKKRASPLIPFYHTLRLLFVNSQRGRYVDWSYTMHDLDMGQWNRRNRNKKKRLKRKFSFPPPLPLYINEV